MNTKIKKINGTQIIKLDHNSLHLYKNTQNIKNLFKKYKNIDKYFDFIYLRIVVKNLHKAIYTLDGPQQVFAALKANFYYGNVYNENPEIRKFYSNSTFLSLSVGYRYNF